jgi:hypothetical protein
MNTITLTTIIDIITNGLYLFPTNSPPPGITTNYYTNAMCHYGFNE